MPRTSVRGARPSEPIRRLYEGLAQGCELEALRQAIKQQKRWPG